jgi:hypothetical protein
MGYDLSWSFVGDEGTHVIEAVREPSAQLFATLDPENGEEADAFYARFYHPDTPDEMVEGASGDERRMVQRLERERFEWMDKTIDALAKVGVLTEAADYLNGRLREVTAQRDGLLGALESFIGRARMGEVNKGMFVRIEELEGLSAAIAAVKGGRDE